MSTAATVEDIQERILAAAEARFGRFGFAKTTVAEIAQDCEMSAGNLYRFFSNKEEIGARVACRCIDEREQAGRDVLARAGLTAAEKFEAFAAEISGIIHTAATRDLLKSDLVEFMFTKRSDLVEAHIEAMRSLIAQLLIEGVRSGEFVVPDIARTSMLVLMSLKSVLYPPFVVDRSPDDVQEDARGIARLLISGLRK